MSHAGVDTGGASRSPVARRRRPWWLWALLALLALALLLLGLTQCGGGDPANDAAGTAGSARTAASEPGNASGGGPSAAATPGAAGAGAAAGVVAAGALTADGTSLLPVAQAAGANGELTAQVGKAVTARGAQVESVPADEGFWVGTSPTDRVWVQLTGTDESGYVVQQGDRVDFTGAVKAHEPGFAAQAGVDAAEGADQLGQQGAHVEVPKSELRRSAA